MRQRVVLLACALAGCGSVGVRPPDASVPSDAPADAARVPICDPTAAFDAPVPLPGFATMSPENVPRLTPDELELYFNGVTGNETVSTLYRAQRKTPSQPFDPPVALTRLHTAAGENDATITSDGLNLFFRSALTTGEGHHLYVAVRDSRFGEFRAPSQVVNVGSTTVTDNDAQPFITAGGEELWFSSNRAGGLGLYDIYRAQSNGSSVSAAAAVLELNTKDQDQVPVLSADRLTIYLATTRPNGKGGLDIWTAHRSTTQDGFPAPTPVPELNSGATDYPGWLSADNCRLYFSSDRAGNPDLYVATRRPK